jgi:chromosome segregation ATPase
MPTHLFIVNRLHPDLCEDLRKRFASDTNVKVILDRRLGARRMRTAPAAAERRRAERRSRPEVDQKLQTASHTMIVSGSSEAANLREAREWVEGIHDRVGAIREVLDSYDRLRREVETIKQAHARLRSDVDQAKRELEDIDSAFARALALANDILSRLRKGATQGPTG